MSHPPITFYYPYPEDLANIDAIDLQDWRFWSASWLSRRRGWLLRTYLQLRKAGYPVQISAEVPHEGILILGPEHAIRRRFLATSWSRRRHLFIVSIRADLVRCTFADTSIVQNGKFADDKRVFYVPHWPQPGLIPRDTNRGSTVQRIAFKGYFPNLNRDFRSDQWKTFLDAHGMTLHVDINEDGDEGKPIRWHDYRETDVVLAVRSEVGRDYFDKPATKLYNAWHAGTPAILGPEYAYRELRRSDLDYIEVTSVEEAQDALLRLASSPDLYRSMVINGFERAREFTFERVTERWAEVLLGAIQPLAREATGASRFTPTIVRRVSNLLRNPPSYDERRAWWIRSRNYSEYLFQAKVRP